MNRNKLVSLSLAFTAIVTILSVYFIDTHYFTVAEQKLYNNMVDSNGKTFKDCYSSIASSLLLASAFSPYSIDLHDPEVKKYITNFCNFGYEKKRNWPDLQNNSTLFMSEYQNEFMQRYGYTSENLPESFKELSNYMNGY